MAKYFIDYFIKWGCLINWTTNVACLERAWNISWASVRRVLGIRVQCRNILVPDPFGWFTIIVCHLNSHKNLIKNVLRPFLDPATVNFFIGNTFVQKISQKLVKANKYLPIWPNFTSISDVLPELRVWYYYFNHTTCFWTSTVQHILCEHFLYIGHRFTEVSLNQNPW